MFGFFLNPSKHKFASRVLQGIKAAGGPDFEYDAAAFEIRHGTNRGFLGNTYVAYCQARGAHRQAILDNFVSAFRPAAQCGGDSFAEAEPRLVTVVRERALFSFSSLYWQLDGATETPRELAEPISKWFVKTAVIDAPGSMMLVNQEHVSRWGQTSDEIFATGLHKLQESTNSGAHSVARWDFRFPSRPMGRGVCLCLVIRTRVRFAAWSCVRLKVLDHLGSDYGFHKILGVGDDRRSKPQQPRNR